MSTYSGICDDAWCLNQDYSLDELDTTDLNADGSRVESFEYTGLDSRHLGPRLCILRVVCAGLKVRHLSAPAASATRGWIWVAGT